MYISNSAAYNYSVYFATLVLGYFASSTGSVSHLAEFYNQFLFRRKCTIMELYSRRFIIFNETMSLHVGLLTRLVVTIANFVRNDSARLSSIQLSAAQLGHSMSTITLITGKRIMPTSVEFCSRHDGDVNEILIVCNAPARRNDRSFRLS